MKIFQQARTSSCSPSNKFSLPVDRSLLKSVILLENLGVSMPRLGRAYSRLFYENMLEKEFGLSGIAPGMKVKHVGCGPFPMTAMFLARKGISVTAVDLDHGILGRAQKVINNNGLQNRIRLLESCGTQLDYSGYSAIWLSLHVSPMNKIVQRALKFMDQDARIIFRAPRGKLSMFYRELNPENLSGKTTWMQIRQPFGKKSIMLKKA